MLAIGESMLTADNLKMANEKARVALRQRLDGLGSKHANGRSVRNILEEAKRTMAVRLSSNPKASATELTTLVADDF